MKDLLTVEKRTAEEEGEVISYELAQISLDDDIKYLVAVKYKQENSLCALDICGRETAENIFTLLVKSHTTPLVLTDTVYDILH